MKSVKIYSTQYCPFCMQAKRLLEQKQIPFEEVDLTEDAETRQQVQEQTGWMTVPMIFIGEEFIGGYQELAALDASGDLTSKLS